MYYLMHLNDEEAFVFMVCMFVGWAVITTPYWLWCIWRDVRPERIIGTRLTKWHHEF